MRILERVAISFSRGSSRPRGRIYISCVGRWIFFFFTSEPPLDAELFITMPVSQPDQPDFIQWTPIIVQPRQWPFLQESHSPFNPGQFGQVSCCPHADILGYALLISCCILLWLKFSEGRGHFSLDFALQGVHRDRCMSGARVDGQRNPEDENWMKSLNKVKIQ